MLLMELAKLMIFGNFQLLSLNAESEMDPDLVPDLYRILKWHLRVISGRFVRLSLSVSIDTINDDSI